MIEIEVKDNVKENGGWYHCANKGSLIFMCCNFHCRIWDGDTGIVASVHWLVEWGTFVFDIDMVISCHGEGSTINGYSLENKNLVWENVRSRNKFWYIFIAVIRLSRLTWPMNLILCSSYGKKKLSCTRRLLRLLNVINSALKCFKWDIRGYLLS